MKHRVRKAASVLTAGWLLVATTGTRGATEETPDRQPSNDRSANAIRTEYTPEPTEAQPTTKVIYGADDRLEEYEVANPALLQLGDSTVMLLWERDLVNNGDGTFTMSGDTFAGFNALCADEPYGSQPAPGFCSGFLVSDDVIATAGHCVTNASECALIAIVFGFVMSDPDSPATTIAASDVYHCGRIIAREEADQDWGLIELDRPVTDHTPLEVRATGRVPDREPLLVIGHPGGLPRKYAAGANVRRNPNTSVFEANLDVYGGNSGSPVFSANTFLVEGVLISGEDDFDYRPAPDDCRVSKTCPDSGCQGESVTRTTVFEDLIPSEDAVTQPRGACGTTGMICYGGLQLGLILLSRFSTSTRRTSVLRGHRKAMGQASD